MLFGVWSMIHRCATSLRFTTFGGAPAKAIDAFEQNRMLGRGVNIIGYDRIWREREHAQFQAKHFTLLKEAGFNSVRVNLHPFHYMDRTPDGWAIRPGWFDISGLGGEERPKTEPPREPRLA